MSTPSPNLPDPFHRHASAYRLLIRLYPSEFRRAHGDLMLQLFRDQHRDACRPGTRGMVLRLWRDTLFDTGKAASREHLAAIRDRFRTDPRRSAPRALFMQTQNTVHRRRSWWLVIVGLVIGTTIAAVVASLRPDQFRATSVLAAAPTISLQSQQTAENRKMTADDTLALMTAEPVLQRTLAKLQEGRDNTNKLVRPGVSANAAQGGMFVMHVTSTNFEYAQKFAAVWAQEFVDFKKQQRQQLIGNTVAQNTQLLLQFEKKFEQAQSALDDFQKKNYPSGLVDAGDTAQRAYDQARAELATLTSELREAEESTAEQHAAATGMQRWFDLKFDVKRAENRLVASPEDAAAKADLALRRADVKAFLELTDEERLAKVASIRRKATSRAKQVRELGDEIFSMTSLRSEYQRLKEDEKRMQDQVAEIRSRATSLDRIWADYEQLDIIQSGGGDPHPIGPNRPYMVLTGLLSGGLIGLLLVGLRALFRKTSGPGGPGTPQGLASSGPVLVHG